MAGIILSICIPTFNRVDFLKKQVDFLVKEYTPDIEVIISDNCSSDGTREYLNSLRLQGFTALINDNNVGAEGNMYRCAGVAKGEYIFFLGDDDPLENGFINYALNLINNYHAAYYHFNYTAYNDKEVLIANKNAIDEILHVENRTLSNSEIIKLVSKYFGPFLFISSNIYRSDIVKGAQNECMNWVETLRWSILAMKSGNSYIDNTSRVLCGVNSSWTDRRGDVWFEAFPSLFDSLLNKGFNKDEVNYMKDNVAAWCIFAYYRSGANHISKIDWNGKIRQLTNSRVRFYLLKMYLKKGLRKIWRVINNDDFYIRADDVTRERFRL